MSFRINTNVNALNAYRNLAQTGMDLSKSTTRLSTGLRITSGADDPAGLIASESYRAQIGGIDQALRNNQDALNYAKTAEGGLDEVNRLLKDARALTVANGNGTLDAAQKQANQSQLNSILSSIDRIAANTQFGTKKLLNGASGTQTTVVSSTLIASASFGGKIGTGTVTANDNVDVQVTTAATQATVTGTVAYATGGTALAVNGSFSVNGKNFAVTSTMTRDGLVNMINSASGETGVTASVNGSNQVVLTQGQYGSEAKINYVDNIGAISAAGTATTAAGVDSVATVTYNDGTTNYTSTFNKGKGLELKDSDGNVVKLTALGNTVATHSNSVRVTAGSTSFQIGANGGQTASLAIGNFSSSALSLSSLDITGSDMSSAMASLDAAISTVSQGRAGIGSFMRNNLESNIRALGVARENLSATESSIREIDVAEEMTQYTKLQILQQSGLSMLAQANSAPQGVLSLLR